MNKHGRVYQSFTYTCTNIHKYCIGNQTSNFELSSRAKPGFACAATHQGDPSSRDLLTHPEKKKRRPAGRGGGRGGPNSRALVVGSTHNPKKYAASRKKSFRRANPFSADRHALTYWARRPSKWGRASRRTAPSFTATAAAAAGAGERRAGAGGVAGGTGVSGERTVGKAESKAGGCVRAREQKKNVQQYLGPGCGKNTRSDFGVCGKK